MPKTYIVAPGRDFIYPADEQSLRLVKSMGGVTKLTDAQRASIKFKTVHEGMDCSDMPAPSRDIYLERGWILEKSAKVPVKPEDKELS